MTSKLTEIFKNSWVRIMGIGSDEDVRLWNEYLESIGCRLGRANHRGLRVLEKLEDSDFHSIFNPTGDGTIIFVPKDIAERALVLGYLPDF